jgi:hypothetical protein
MLGLQTSTGGMVWKSNRATISHLQPIDLLVTHFISYHSSRNFQAMLPDLALF